MELSFKDLAKREVINMPDGRCLGHIVDLTLDFPRGILTGITVPAKKSIFNIFGWHEKLFIEEYKIKKIGSDVILVDLKACPKRVEPPKQPQNCRPDCPPPCPPPHPSQNLNKDQFSPYQNFYNSDGEYE